MFDFLKKYSDQDLVNGLKADSEKVRLVTYKRLKPDIEHFFKKNYGSTNIDFEDVFSVTFIDFLKLIRKENFELKAALKTIFIDILKKRIADKFRSNKRFIVDTLENLNLKTESIEQTLIGNEIIEFVIQKLKELGDSCYNILIKTVEGFSNEDIAKILGLANAKTVASRKYTCRERLKEAIKTDYPNIYNF